MSENLDSETVSSSMPPPNYLHGRRKPKNVRELRMPLLQYLAVYGPRPVLNTHELRRRINEYRDEYVRALKNLEIRYRQHHIPPTVANCRIAFVGFGLPARTQYAYNGFKKVTVEQHYYSRHRLSLEHPHLQCLMNALNENCNVYVPAELLDVVLYV